MPKADVVFRSRLVRCKHEHVSGRRCSQRVNRSTPDKLCGLHPILDIDPTYTSCKECRSMMDAFLPPKGWPSIDR